MGAYYKKYYVAFVCNICGVAHFERQAAKDCYDSHNIKNNDNNSILYNNKADNSKKQLNDK